MAFTLVELLVVISIVAVLMAMLLPGLKKVRDTAKNIKCLVNQRQVHMAVINYTGDFQGMLPYWWGSPADAADGEPYGYNYWPYRVGVTARGNHYLPLPANLSDTKQQTAWRCTFASSEVPGYGQGSNNFSLTYAFNRYLVAFRTGSAGSTTWSRSYGPIDGTYPTPTHAIRIDQVSSNILAIADNRSNYTDWSTYTTLAFTNTALWDHLNHVPWPVVWRSTSDTTPDLYPGDVVDISRHYHSVNVTGIDGHGETIGGKWDVDALQNRVAWGP